MAGVARPLPYRILGKHPSNLSQSVKNKEKEQFCMSKLSCSFTLGKQSTGNANIEHNNREFISNNVDVSRLADNIVYVREDVRDVYDELFGEALKDYNAKQKRNDRKIHDYFEYVMNDSRKEAYYEIIVQFGDSDTAGIGTADGKFAIELLDEYARSFQQRNPNLRVINQIMHNDESSPHLHIPMKNKLLMTLKHFSHKAKEIR
jgi:hypothetical protein